MTNTVQSQSLTSYIKEIRKTESFNKPAIVIPVNTRPNRLYLKKTRPASATDSAFEEWTMPPQQGGYIKCVKHDFL
jgi:hypothetical protein